MNLSGSPHNRIFTLFLRARDLVPSEQYDFLLRECDGDSHLRSEVDALLKEETRAETLFPDDMDAEAADDDRAATGPALKQGLQLSHYRLLEKIGEGGMGVVWKAEDITLDRIVAIKLIAKASSDDKGREMFLKEARLASTLVGNSRIAQIYEFGQHDERDFIAMEYVEGKSLDDLLKDGPLSILEAARLGVQIAQALADAHEKGLLHRDVKPSNVMITRKGQIKIVDFGVATLLAPAESQQTENEPGEGRPLEASLRTRMGTVPYMSPEQLRGERLDKTSDVFSLGAVLYEMVAGETPFAADSLGETVSHILQDRMRPLHQAAPAVPAELERVIHKCLAARGHDRYQTMESLVENLQTIIQATAGSGESVPSTAAGGAQATGMAFRIIAIGVVAIGLVTLAATQLMDTGPVQADRGASEESTAIENPAALLQPVQRGNLRQLTFTGSAELPLWSPSGQEIAYFDAATTEILTIPVDGGRPRAIKADVDKLGFAWNWGNQGRWLLAGREGRGGQIDIVSISLHQQPPRIVVEGGWYPSASRDGRFLAYATHKPGHVLDEILVLDKTTGQTRSIVRSLTPGSTVYKPTWSPDGKRIAYVRWDGLGSRLWVFDTDTGTSTRVAISPLRLSGHFCWNAAGDAILSGALHQGTWSLWWIPVPHGQITRLTSSLTSERHASLSPDGTAAAFEVLRDASRIMVIDLETGNAAEPVDLSIAARSPSFSSGGSELYFQALVNGRWQVWKDDLRDTLPAASVISAPDESAMSPTVGESGRLFHIRTEFVPMFVFGRIDWDQSLWRSDNGQSPYRVVGAGERVSRLAPTPQRNGNTLYAARGDDGLERLYLLDTNGIQKLLFQETETEWFGGFDWGPGEDEVVLALGTFSAGLFAPHPDNFGIHAINIHSLDVREIYQSSGSFSHSSKYFERYWSLAVSPGRTEIAYVAHAEEGWAIYVLSDHDTAPREIHKIGRKPHIDRLTWSPDGRHLAFDLHEYRSDIFVLEGLDGPL